MQDADFAVLATNFQNHKENEEAWQIGIDEKLDNIAAMLRPIQEDLREHTQTLFGPSPDKDNGLNSDMKSLKTWRQVADARWYKLVAILVAIELLFSALNFVTKSGIVHYAPPPSSNSSTIQPK